MNGEEFYQYILNALKRTDKEAEVFEALKDTINDMIMNLPFEEFKNEQITKGIEKQGEYCFGLPVNFSGFITNVTIADESKSSFAPLKKISKQEWDELIPNPQDNNITGVPSHYCVFGNRLFIYPVPDKITYDYTVCCGTYLTDTLTRQSEYIPLSDQYRETLKYGVLFRVLADLQDFETAVNYQGLYVKYFEKAEANNNAKSNSVQFVKYNDI